jgi:hypothetical protein
LEIDSFCSKNKVYSLHEPEVQCIAKGKEAKPYEFGNKSSIAKTKSGAVIGHLKQDHRMQRNYLKGNVGEQDYSCL